MAERNFTDADIKALGKEIGSAIGKGGGGGGGAGQTLQQSGKGLKDIDAAATKAAESLNPFGLKLKSGGEYAADGLKAIKNAVDDGMGTWRDLSKSGVSFNNDIIGMTTAAAGSRLPLADFASVVKDNAANFAGLGGSVTRGAEAFAKMSKGFFESGATDNLKQLGYSSKDLNEMLALQAISVRGIVKNDEERNRVAFEGANKLATEMDAMAKLTGKSREVQMEAMKKQQTDMQFEASIRLKAMEIADPVKRAEFETNARDQLRKAEMDGRGAMFKEYFAFGNIVSKEAGQQASLMQGQAKATREAAMTSANAKLESDERMRKADEAQEKARLEAVKDASDKNLLQMRALPASTGGPITDILNKQALTMDTYTKSIENAAAKNNLNLKDPEDLKKAQQIALEDVKKAQAGQNEQGKQVDGSTKALVQFGNSVEHIRAGMIKGLLDPINEKVSPQLSRFGDNLRELNSNFQGKGNIGAQTERAARAGVEAGANDKPAGPRREQPVAETGPMGLVQFGGRVLGAGANIFEKGAGAGNDYLEGQPKAPAPKPSRAFGSMGAAGKLFEDWGAGTDVTLHGMEAVVRPDDFKNIFKSSLGGIGQAFEKTPSNMQMPQVEMPAIKMPKIDMPKIDMPKIDQSKLSMQSLGLDFSKLEIPKIPSLDINKISQDISTSISGGGSSSIKLDAAALADMTRPFEKSFTDFNTGFEDIVSNSSKGITFAPFEESFDEFGSNFDDVVARMSKDLGTAMPTDMFDEFGSNFDDVVARMSNDLGTAMPTDMFDEFSTNFDGVVTRMATDLQEAMPLDSIDQTANALEYASKRRQELEDIMNDGIARSGTEWDEIFDEAEQLDGQIEKLTNKQIDAMSRYADGWGDTSDIMDQVYADIDDAMPIDTEFGNLEGAMKAAQERMYPDTEFGDLDGAMKYAANQTPATENVFDPGQTFNAGDEHVFDPTADAMRSLVEGSSPTTAQAGDSNKISMDSFTMSKNGMPIFKPKSTASAVPSKPAEKQASPGKAINPETGEEYTPLSELEKQAGATKADAPKSAGSSGKAATLDDVVKSLNALNTKMGQLIDVNETGHKASAKAAKSSSANLYS